jgi:hypothetical protein
MPGMMDTILDLGMNDAVEQALAQEPGAEEFARDTRRRFTGMYRRIVGEAGAVPDDPYTQLRAGIEAVFGKQIRVDGFEGEVREGDLAPSAWSENETQELRELADVARRISPLRAHATGDYAHLDDPSAAAVQAALDAGRTDVVSAAPLVVMMTALRLADAQ